MAVRVRDFSHAHPSADPSFVSILGRLEEADQPDGGARRVSRRAAFSRGTRPGPAADVRRRLREGLLRHLVTIAEDASAEQPQLLEMFRLPPSERQPRRVPGRSSRKPLEQGVAQKELLVKHGLSRTSCWTT